MTASGCGFAWTQMDIVLYGTTDTNAWRVQWILNELKIPYEHSEFDIHAAGVKNDPIYEEILALNPNATLSILKRSDDVV
jgi:glutathione S-transferase